MDPKIVVAELAGLPSETLEVFRLPPARTLFVSDHKTVFAKIISAHDGVRERSGALHATQVGVPTPRLLNYGECGDSAVFIFEHLGGDLSSLLEPLPVFRAIWEAPHPETHEEVTFAPKVERSMDNLARAGGGPRSEDLRRLLADFYLEGTELSRDRGHLWRPTWVHGDAHRRNFYSQGSSNGALDWEWHGVGPRELDLAKWVQVELSEDGHPQNARQLWLDTLAQNEELKMDFELALFEVRHSAARAYSYQLVWGTRLDWLDKLWSLALGEDENFKELEELAHDF